MAFQRQRIVSQFRQSNIHRIKTNACDSLNGVCFPSAKLKLNQTPHNCSKLLAQAFRLIAFLVFCCLHGSQTALAQYRFDSWTTDNGLPQNGVRTITQTPDGYLWLTTFDGLVRFDGVKFTVFDKNNSRALSTTVSLSCRRLRTEVFGREQKRAI